jgi:hypothetical protein
MDSFDNRRVGNGTVIGAALECNAADSSYEADKYSVPNRTPGETSFLPRTIDGSYPKESLVPPIAASPTKILLEGSLVLATPKLGRPIPPISSMSS